jgi:acetoin utilization deacetylase AcuC-like enzyme
MRSGEVSPLQLGARAWRRLRYGPWGRPTIRVVHGRNYGVALPDGAFDPLRGQRILSFLLAERLVRRRHVHRVPRPVSMRLLRRVHSESYLESLSVPEALTAILGFEISDEQHDRFLLAQREQVGGTVLASRLASERAAVVANLGGGFHHALAARGAGFCAFNDVAVAIAERRAAGFDGPVLVVDLDLHDGDGTRRIFAADDTVHTFSIHNRHLAGLEAVASTSVALGDDVDDATYLDAVRRHLDRVLRGFRPALVFYLAGCDPALDDRLGNWRISGEALLARDRFVVDRLRGSSPPVPLVILLAGGYGHEAWRYSARFLASLCAAGRTVEPPPTDRLPLERYRRVSRSLSAAELTREPSASWELTEADVEPGRTGPRFLGFYSRHGIEAALERTGFLDELRRRGHASLRVELRADSPREQTLVVRSEGSGEESLVELRAHRDSRTVPGMHLLWLDWLLLQNPAARFTAERPRLPGQRHPGLGLLREMSAMLVVICERLGLDGIAFVPSHYHIAAQAHSHFRFLDPEAQARFEKLRQALAGTKLVAAIRALEEGRVRNRTDGTPFLWVPSPMLVAVSPRLRERLREAAYRERVDGFAKRCGFVVD